MGERTYIAIDLKSFYASVECVELGLDPLDANLVVADRSRTEKTICLAVSPALKAIGIPGRARLFEVVQQVKTENARRRGRLKGSDFSGKSSRTISWQNPGWRSTWSTAPESTIYIQDLWRRRIYMSIP